jgi:phosphopantetheine--protein transferase-like protein
MSEFYFYDLSNKELNLEELKMNLPMDVIAHCERYHNEQDIRNSLFAWSQIFKDKKIPKEARVSFNDFGKPSIPTVEFNLSHSGDMVAIVYSNNNCGIDIQLVDTGKDLTEMSERVLTSKEKKIYDETEDKALFFTKCWTKKEAYYKRLGQGIDLHKLNQEFDDPSWVEQEVNDSEGRRYVITVSAKDINVPTESK